MLLSVACYAFQRLDFWGSDGVAIDIIIHLLLPAGICTSCISRKRKAEENSSLVFPLRVCVRS